MNERVFINTNTFKKRVNKRTLECKSFMVSCVAQIHIYCCMIDGFLR